MKLIFALGNTGKQYTNTRHNIGFSVLDGLLALQNGTFQEKTKFKAHVAEVLLHGEKIILAKPTTLYNNSGDSYRTLLDFYKLEPKDTLVIHDELMLPFGTIRLRAGGSDAGNNGIKSINLHGGADSYRVRIGIGSVHRELIGDTGFVLGTFSKSETAKLSTIIETATSACEQFATGLFAVTSISHD